MKRDQSHRSPFLTTIFLTTVVIVNSFNQFPLLHGDNQFPSLHGEDHVSVATASNKY